MARKSKQQQFHEEEAEETQTQTQTQVPAEPAQPSKPASFLQLSFPSASSSTTTATSTHGTALTASATPATTSSAAPASAATVAPLVLLSVLDHFLRRKEGQTQILGALLGYRSMDAATSLPTVQVVNSFPLAHTETADRKVVIDTEYFSRMYALHQRVNAKETIVGWYTATTTRTAAGDDGAESVQTFAVLFAGETAPAAPVVLVVDPEAVAVAGSTSFPVQAFVSVPAGVPDASDPLSTLYVEIPVSTGAVSDSDKAGLDLITAAASAITLSDDEMAGLALSLGSDAPVTSDLDALDGAVRSVHDMLESVAAYVDGVIEDGSANGDKAAIGRFLMDTVSLIPRLDPDAFSQVFNSHMQDLLMVLYLANLTRTQVAVAERLYKMV
ncbi:hypothetical protein BC831DRAFT_460008 [Entophlyctis helioformis]|nr:hypothetical protein BC831DRAFT_460008 [Entophlyctis helioformis]